MGPSDRDLLRSNAVVALGTGLSRLTGMLRVVVFGIIIVYQQFENYVISPKVTARTMELHPAIAFGAALAGLSILGPSGALLALPVAAMGQAIASETGRRHATVDSGLLDDDPPKDDE